MATTGTDGKPRILPLPLGATQDRGASRTQQVSTKAQRQEFFLPVTGFVWYYPEEVAVINHPAFQRLARINQLGQAHLVFRGATHKRIEHVLGAVGVVQRMISAVEFNAEKAKAKGRPGACSPLSLSEERFVRLGALLHDIGHLAAGHTLEDELELIGKHDADERLSLIFGMEQWGEGEQSKVISLQALIDSEFAKYLPKKLAESELTPTDIVRLLIRKPPVDKADQFAAKQHLLQESGEIRLHVCMNMIGNTICADLLDYLYRDWYHIGKPRAFEDRIFQYMEIRRPGQTREHHGVPDSRAEDRFVVSLGEDTQVRSDGVTGILALLEWRYELAETVLFHRTKLAAAAMLDRGLYELWSDQSEESLINKLLLLSDHELIDEALREALGQLGRTADNPQLDAAVRCLTQLRDRNLYEELATFDATNLPHSSILAAKRDYSGVDAPSQSGAKNRARTARILEKNYDLASGSVSIYCAAIKPKIAEVSIDVDGEILPFNAFEKKHKNRLSGGHLEAQESRFERLWRIHFFIDPKEKAQLSPERLAACKSFIRDVILAVDSPEILAQKVREKAHWYVQQELKRGKNGVSYQEKTISFARSVLTSPDYYPNGAPSMDLFIERSDGTEGNA